MRKSLGLSFVIVLLFVGVGLIIVRLRPADRRSAVCAALEHNVGDLDVIAWGNGYTLSGANWIGVLTDGVQFGREADRVGMAAAVTQDSDGYARLYDAAPDDFKPVLKRQHTLAVDAVGGFAHRNDPQVNADSMEIYRFGSSECDLAG